MGGDWEQDTNSHLGKITPGTDRLEYNGKAI